LTDDNFESSKIIKIVTKQNLVFVQTDKATYKPADKVQLRVLLLDDDLRPFADAGKVEIFITDGEQNRVKQFSDPHFESGVFQGELQLSDLPVLGVWKIHVTINGKSKATKEFEVAEYVLPKFEFILDANPDANFKEGKITATARAKYTFGKIAKGNATITAEVDGLQQHKVTKSIKVDGKKHFEIDIERELKMSEKHREQTVNMFATFTEELSGKEQNASAKVKIHPTPYKMELKKSSDKFKPGLKFEFTAVVSYHDKNAPVTDSRNPVQFTVKYFCDDNAKCIEFNGTHQYEEQDGCNCHLLKSYDVRRQVFVKNGLAAVDLEIPMHITKVKAEARYLVAVEKLEEIEKVATQCNEYIQAQLVTKR
jgi:CD109 antigen